MDVAVSLTPTFLSATGFTLSKVSEIIDPNQMYNYQVKSFLILGEGIKFCPSTRQNKSLMFFSLDLLADDIS